MIDLMVRYIVAPVAEKQFRGGLWLELRSEVKRAGVKPTYWCCDEEKSIPAMVHRAANAASGNAPSALAGCSGSARRESRRLKTLGGPAGDWEHR